MHNQATDAARKWRNPTHCPAVPLRRHDINSLSRCGALCPCGTSVHFDLRSSAALRHLGAVAARSPSPRFEPSIGPRWLLWWLWLSGRTSRTSSARNVLLWQRPRQRLQARPWPCRSLQTREKSGGATCGAHVPCKPAAQGRRRWREYSSRLLLLPLMHCAASLCSGDEGLVSGSNGERPAWWWTGPKPTPGTAGVQADGTITSLPLPCLATCTRQQVTAMSAATTFWYHTAAFGACHMPGQLPQCPSVCVALRCCVRLYCSTVLLSTMQLYCCPAMQALEYFDNTWLITEVLFSALQGECRRPCVDA
jgi:hypothetical protein